VIRATLVTVHLRLLARIRGEIKHISFPAEYAAKPPD